MIKTFVALASIFIVINCFAAFPVAKPADSTVVESKEQKEKAPVKALKIMSWKDYENLTGKKMNFIQRLEFKIGKKRIENQLKKPGKHTSGFNIPGFLLGFLLPFYGVIIAYVFSKDRNLRKWAWIGLGTVLVVSLFVLLGVMLANFK